MALSNNNLTKLTQLQQEMKAREHRTKRTTEIISVFAFLIGVRKTMFLNEHEPHTDKRHQSQKRK